MRRAPLQARKMAKPWPVVASALNVQLGLWREVEGVENTQNSKPRWMLGGCMTDLMGESFMALESQLDCADSMAQW